MGRAPIFNEEEKKYILENLRGQSFRALHSKLVERFGSKVDFIHFKYWCAAHKLRNGVNSRFNKGDPKRTITNVLPIGTIREYKGQVFIKVEQPHGWKMQKALVWEAANGPISKGHVILCLDGNIHNANLDNLACVSRAELVKLNQNKLISHNREVTKTGILIAKLLLANNEAERKLEKGDKQ